MYGFGKADAKSMDYIPNESIDYIFTDPPYGWNIPFLGLSLFWSSWLRQELDFDNEIAVAEHRPRQHELTKYREDLRKAFIEMFRVLKPGAFLSITFHNTWISVWNALVSAAQEAHFEYLNDVYQVPAVVSAKAQTQIAGSMTGDIIVNFRRPIGAQPRLMVNNIDAESIIIEETRRILIERGGEATRDQLMRGIVSELMHAGALHKLRQETYIESVLDLHFTKLGPSHWRLKQDSPANILSYIPLQSRIRWIIQSVLATSPASLDEILVAIFTNLKNGRTPDKHEILTVLQKIAKPETETKKPRWVLRPRQLDFEKGLDMQMHLDTAAGEPIDHSRIIAILAHMAERCGCLCHIGEAERQKNPGLEDLSHIKELSFPPLTTKEIRQNRINQIDLIWHRPRTTPVALFEVEHTTGVSTCIPRLANLRSLLPHLAIPAFIVGPDSLLSRAARQFTMASSKSLLQEGPGDWFFLPYTKLLRIADRPSPLWSPPSIAELCGVAIPASQMNP